MRENIVYLNQSEILERGWSKTLINRLLSEPILKKNPKYARAAPMKLWDSEEVMKIEKSSDYIKAREELLKRRERAKKVAETKTDELVDEMIESANQIEITVIDDDVLRKLVFESQREWYNYQDEIKGNAWEYHDVENASEEVISRWIVNYIRHNLVDYDTKLESIKGRIGVSTGYSVYKSIVLKRIAENYPKYAEECYRQIGYT